MSKEAYPKKSKLKEIREQRNLTQEELSDSTGISVRTIQRIESGNEPKGQTLKILLNTLGIEKHELLNNEENPEETIQAYINLSTFHH